MTQTVSLQRGSTTANSGSLVTLFTLGASGTANRVIFNSIVVRFTSGGLSNWAGGGCTVLWTPSGGTPMPVGGAYTDNNTNVSCYGVALVPASNVQAPVTVANYGSQNFSGGNLISYQTGSTNNFGNSNMFVAFTNPHYGYFMAPQVWAGPSDALQFRQSFYTGSGKSITYTSATVYWDAVVINES